MKWMHNIQQTWWEQYWNLCFQRLYFAHQFLSAVIVHPSVSTTLSSVERNSAGPQKACEGQDCCFVVLRVPWGLEYWVIVVLKIKHIFIIFIKILELKPCVKFLSILVLPKFLRVNILLYILYISYNLSNEVTKMWDIAAMYEFSSDVYWDTACFNLKRITLRRLPKEKYTDFL